MLLKMESSELFSATLDQQQGCHYGRNYGQSHRNYDRNRNYVITVIITTVIHYGFWAKNNYVWAKNNHPSVGGDLRMT